jgi:hypothetical protein
LALTGSDPPSNTIVKYCSIAGPSAWVDPIWSPVGHIIGELYPYNPHLPPNIMEEGRKFMVASSWKIKMVDYASRDDIPKANVTTAQRVNDERQNFPRGTKTFIQLLPTRCTGISMEIESTSSTPSANSVPFIASPVPTWSRFQRMNCESGLISSARQYCEILEPCLRNEYQPRYMPQLEWMIVGHSKIMISKTFPTRQSPRRTATHSSLNGLWLI